MKTLKAKKDFILDNVHYAKGDEVKTTNPEIIRKLNEKGYIEPLAAKELATYFNKTESKKTTTDKA